jgi:hypothetical protein
MTIARWNPPVAPTRREQFLLKRLGRVRKLFGFLRVHRHELFTDAFQDELASMYRTTGAGREALPPAMMAMAMLVQGYLSISDAEMVELTVVDLRVQMVLGCLDSEEPAFSQGALQEFRQRLIAADLDRRVLECTVELANRTKAFDPRKLPKSLRVAIDSSPLVRLESSRLSDCSSGAGTPRGRRGGHVDVEQDDIRPVTNDRGERCFAVDRRRRGKSQPLHYAAHELQGGCLVIDDEHRSAVDISASSTTRSVRAWDHPNWLLPVSLC